MDCQYFALCTNEAEWMIPNPMVGDVPTCQRCADKYVALGGALDNATRIDGK